MAIICPGVAHPNLATASALIAVVACVSLILLVLAAAAWRRTGNSKLGFVTAAFACFFVKSAVTAYAIATEGIHHEDLELLGTAFDLAIVLLLVAPFIPVTRRLAQRQP